MPDISFIVKYTRYVPRAEGTGMYDCCSVAVDLIGTAFDVIILAYPLRTNRRRNSQTWSTSKHSNPHEGKQGTFSGTRPRDTAILCTPFTHAISRRQKNFASCLSLKDVSLIMSCFTKRLVPAN